MVASDIEIFLKKKKKKNESMVVNDIKMILRMTNKAG